MRRRKRVGHSGVEHPAGRTLRQGLGAGALAAIIIVVVSFAVGASPLAPPEPLSSRLSLFHQALIYALEGSPKLVDGRWNLSQSESKLGITLSADETRQLMACTGQIVCATPGGKDEDGDEVEPKVLVSATGVSVLRPDLLITAKHVLFQGKTAKVPFGSCSFRSYSHRKVAIPILVEQDQRKGYVLKNEDFVVLRLKRALAGCNAFAINDSDSSLPEGEQVLSVTGHQLRMLNKISGREPVIAKGTIRRAFSGVLGGPPFYYADIDFDVGGSGGAVFALTDGRPVSDGEGRLVLRGISVAYGLQAKNGKPYSDERNHTIIIGLQAEFRDLVKGKAHKPAVEPAPCPEGGAPKIDVISESVPLTQSDALAPSLRQYEGLKRAAWWQPEKPKRVKKRRAKQKPAKQPPVKQKHAFTLKNDTSCRICFTYRRCNDYGCWDEAVRLSAKSSLSAGVSELAPAIKNPQFCK